MSLKLLRRITLQCIVHSLSLFCFAVLCANDTKVTVAAGGIITENQETDVEMASENLEISIGKIKVT